MMFWMILLGLLANSAMLPTLLQQDSWESAAKRGATDSWYDADQKQLNYPEGKWYARDLFADRMDSIAKPPAPSNWKWNWNLNWMGNWLQIMFYIGAILVVTLLIIGILYWVNSESGRSSGRSKGNKSQEKADQARLTDLPFAVQASDSDLLAASDKARLAGDYSKAIIFLFSHMLLELDQARKIRLQRGKTNGMYLKELRRFHRLRAILQKVALSFEWVYFGKHALSNAAFSSCWELLPAFQKELETDTSETSSTTEAVRP